MAEENGTRSPISERAAAVINSRVFSGETETERACICVRASA